ncbi:DNA polymerase beta domain protein region [Rippkaea orientalis PCC 8801]|uniref:DNA polymerase beta domain protein region n=1 Tax=Rippkaea orientalis (strain PCC 8801 / RF-1) TaxID=41431 RepID=B7JVD4_RIPO1|nr:nucleotidyltransferase domain-containing protein [Rippkaea orientalis]ACK68267.1 DNA polymerase beta domain protein region [Rippkaea orientalis PCC 8801]
MLTKLDKKIEQRLGLSEKQIAEFCQQWGIIELSLLGSVFGDQFHVDSDIDILIRFRPNTPQGLLTLAQIKHDLENRIGRTVDIAIKQSVENSENPIRRDQILKTSQVIYAQR